MRNRLFAAAAALLLVGRAGAHAGTLSFLFSFSNVDGSVPGTVTGEITGLADAGTSSATHVFIDSFPSALGLSLTTPFDTIGDSALNSFTVSNGQITGGEYFSVGVGVYELGINPISNNFLESVSSNGEVHNSDGLAGLSFTAVPEPSTWAMMILGFAALCAARYRRRLFGPAASAT